MERKLSGGEKRSKESHFKKLKKHRKDFRKQYGDDAESVMHAVATKRAKGESIQEDQPSGLRTKIWQSALKHGLPPHIMIALAKRENASGNPDAIGDTHLDNNAFGIFQVRKPALDDVNTHYGLEYDVKDLADVDKNIDIGMKYFAMMSDKYGAQDMDTAISWYNGGPNFKGNNKEYVNAIKTAATELQTAKTWNDEFIAQQLQYDSSDNPEPTNAPTVDDKPIIRPHIGGSDKGPDYKSDTDNTTVLGWPDSLEDPGPSDDSGPSIDKHTPPLKRPGPQKGDPDYWEGGKKPGSPGADYRTGTYIGASVGEKDENQVKGYDTKTITALADLKLRYPHAPDTLSAMLRAIEDIKAASKGADRDVEREIDDLELRIKSVETKMKKHKTHEARNSRFPTTTMTADFVNWLKSQKITMVQLDDPVKRWNMMQQYKKDTGKNVIPLGNEGKSPHKKGSAKYKKHMAAMHAGMNEMKEWIKVNEGYYTLPSIDRERYDEIPGMDGPIMTRSGKVVYYDPKSGQYYDRDSDMFLTHDEWKALDSVSGQRESRVHDDDMDQAAKLRRRIARAKRAGDIDIQKKAEEELKAIFAKGLHVNRAQEDINEADEPLAILRRIVDNKQAEKIHGIIVDMFTASALVQVYDKVNDENQIKMKKFLQSAQGLERMAEFALSKLS